MSTALYRRYRPDTFDQVIGQTHVTDPLRAALQANRVTHAYLFSGPRGCGKTTSARILARCLNCAQGPTAHPCGTCESCVELATGGSGSLDVVEIDAASHGGVDDARDLRERASFAPVRDRYKIFIVDEAHMVTAAGFNALLKLVEEPPEHVKFVFATTEPEKVLGTIRSRTHHYPFRLVPPDVLAPYLQQLCVEENITVEAGVIPLVMRAGGGSVRDTLSVLDQLMAGAVDASVSYATAVALLGYTDQALLDQTVDALAGGDGAAVYRVVEHMVDSGHDPRRFVEDLLQRLRDLLIIAVAGDGAAEVLSETPADQLERMFVQARNWGPHQLSRAADLTDQALRSMTGATSPRLQVELLIGRILVPVDVNTVSSTVNGAVGMAGGGAPTTAEAQRSQHTAEEGRFGAKEARRAYQERRQAQAVATQTSVNASSMTAPHEGHPGRQEPASVVASIESKFVGGSAAPVSAPVDTAEVRQSSQGGAWPDVQPPGMSAQAGFAHEQSSVMGAESAHISPPPVFASASSATSPEEAHPQGHTVAAPRQDEPARVQVEPTDLSVAESANPSAISAVDPAGMASASSMSPVTEAPATAVGGREADMLRNRWSEVISRLATTSRVVWSMLSQNGQLGAVDSSTAVILLPTEGMVANFNNAGRAEVVASAIYEVAGLTVSVRAEVGQASGGDTVTTPSAPASQPFRHAVEGVPRAPVRSDKQSVETAAAVETDHLSGSADQTASAVPAVLPPTADEDRVLSTAWPEVTLPPDSSELASVEVSAHSAENEGAPAAWLEVTLPPDDAESANTGFAEAEATGVRIAPPEVQPAQADIEIRPQSSNAVVSNVSADLEVAAASSDSVATIAGAESFEDYIPGDPDARWESLETRFQRIRSGETVFADNGGPADGVDSGNDERNEITWGNPVGADSIEEVAAEAIAHEVSASEDDSASLDDDNVTMSTRFGLPAVLDILGGTIVEPGP